MSPSPPKKMRLHNGWSSKKEKLLKFWQEECRLYVWLHNQNSTHYRRLDRYISIPAILITAITGTAVFATIGEEDNRVVQICIGTMLIIGTFLQSIRDFLDITDLIHRNTNCSKSYQSIVNDIEEQLSQDREDREDGKILLRKIKTRKNDIVRNGAGISSKTWQLLKKNMEKGEVINLYNTDFFHNYIHSLDNADYIPGNEYIGHSHDNRRKSSYEFNSNRTIKSLRRQTINPSNNYTQNGNCNGNGRGNGQTNNTSPDSIKTTNIDSAIIDMDRKYYSNELNDNDNNESNSVDRLNSNNDDNDNSSNNSRVLLSSSFTPTVNYSNTDQTLLNIEPINRPSPMTGYNIRNHTNDNIDNNIDNNINNSSNVVSLSSSMNINNKNTNSVGFQDEVEYLEDIETNRIINPTESDEDSETEEYMEQNMNMQQIKSKLTPSKSVRFSDNKKQLAYQLGRN